VSEERRYGRGRMNLRAPIGAILGPNGFGELLVVTGWDERGSLVGLATTHDIEAAMRVDSPRTVTEAKLWRKAQKGGIRK
jgi:hypothetical protein